MKTLLPRSIGTATGARLIRAAVLGMLCRLVALLATIAAFPLNTHAANPTFPAPHWSPSPRVLEQIQTLELDKSKRTPGESKIDSQLLQLCRQKKGLVPVPGLADLQPTLQTAPDSTLLLDLKAIVSPDLLQFIEQRGGTVVSTVPRHQFIRLISPLPLVESLSLRADVLRVRPASQATTHSGAVVSEGDTTHRTAEVREFYGIQGAGVRIGVLSDGVDRLVDSQSRGELPEVRVIPGQAGGPGQSEGTAMLEIIHDIAPAAELHFATALAGEAAFAENIRALYAAGCRIIVDDVTYFAESPFQDDLVSQAVNEVSAGGALYLAAAGNSGNKSDGTSGTWEGDFVDGGTTGLGRGGRLHDFGGTTSNPFLEGGGFRRVDLSWADPLGASTNDYDVYVLNAAGQVVASSTNIQDGNDDPYESIPNVSNGERILIVKYAGAGRFLSLRTGRARLAISTTGSVYGHNASSAPNALSVAATWVRSPALPFTGGPNNPVETFSSDGPRRLFFRPDGSPFTPGNFSASGGQLIPKPDITAADGVATTVVGFERFFGTSAAAPHAAAIAALLWSYNPSLSAADIKQAITQSALDIEAPGRDVDSGAGVLSAPNAILALKSPKPRLGWVQVQIDGGNGNGSLDPSECNQVRFTIGNRIGTNGVSATSVSAALRSLHPAIVVEPAPVSLPDIPPAGQVLQSAPFLVSVLQGFSCAETPLFQLELRSANGGSVTQQLTLPVTPGGEAAPIVLPATSLPLSLPDLRTVESELQVDRIQLPLSRVRVLVHLTHPYLSDLQLSLISPDGTAVRLMDRNGNSGSNLGTSCDTPTLFDDRSTNTLIFARAPYAGSVQPLESLALFQGKSGSSVNGTWKLRLADVAEPDAGSLVCWSLEVTTLSCPQGNGECFSPPSITQQPQSLTLLRGQSASFRIQAQGTAPLSYQWRRQGVGLIPGASQPALNLPQISPADEGIYEVVLSNRYGTLTSAPASLTLVSPPQIVTQPSDLFLIPGRPGSFTLQAQGSPPLAYQWFRSPLTPLLEETEPSLRFDAAGPADAGGYLMVITNLYGSITSRVATLHLGSPPNIITQPSDVSATQGANASFTVAVSGTPPITYQWFQNERILVPGATNPVLTFNNLNPSQAGGYHAYISNAFGTALSRQAQLTVQPPNDLPIISLISPSQPTTYTSANLPVLLEATASDPDGRIVAVEFRSDQQPILSLTNPPYRFEWKDPAPGPHRIDAVAFDNLGGRTQTTNILINVNAAAVRSVALIDTGAVWKYWDQGRVPSANTEWQDPQFDDSTWSSGPAELGYGDAPGRPEKTIIQFGNDPNNKFVTAYFRHSFHVGDPYSVTQLQFRLIRDDGAAVYLNGTELYRDNLPAGTLDFATLASPAVNNAAESTYFTNRIAPVTLLVQGRNTVAVEIHQSATNSSDLSFDLGLVALREFSPRLQTQPESAIVEAGEILMLDVEATGGTPLNYRWFFNQTNPIAGATSPILTLGPLKTNQSGSYSVVVTNSFGVVTSSLASITVLTPASNQAPLLTWTSPADASSYSLENWPPLLAVDASDTDGGIAEVRFLADNRTLARITRPPYTLEWVDARLGTHTLQAIATDIFGASTTSSIVRIQIELPGEETPIPLVPLNALWNYDDTGQFPGPSWFAIAFDDSSWLSGPAELGYGDGAEGRPEQTQIRFGDSATSKYSTTYFRHAFWVTDLRHITGLQFSLLRDDGAAVYLNGQEILRNNLADGSLGFTNLALAAINGAAETNLVILQTNQANLRLGLNLIAAEIHQSSPSSSDLSFALGIEATRAFPPEITRQPANLQVTNGAAAVFTIVADGAKPLSYQWFFNTNTPLPSATNATLRFSNVSSNRSGFYRVTISNSFGSIVSSNAQLVVVPPPPNQPPLASIINPADNTTLEAGRTILIQATASDPEGQLASLDFLADDFKLGTRTNAPFQWDWPNAIPGSHTLRIRATDIAGLAATSPPVRIVVSTPVIPTLSLVSTGSTWRYLDDGSNQGSLWRALAFKDTSWRTGQGVFGYGNGVKGRPDTTELNPGTDPNKRIITHYFRHAFVVTNTSLITRLTLETLRDDGVSVYLNGTRIQRNNLPGGTLGYQTLASSSVTGADETSYVPQDVPLSLLTVGTNLLAAELHQSALNSTDAAFDARLSAAANSAPFLLTQPFSQSISNGEPAEFTVVAAGSGTLRYQWTFNQTNVISGNDSPILRFPSLNTNQAGSYAVTVRNNFGQVQSTQALLRVLVPTPNQLPSISLLSPTNGSVYARGSIITLNAKPSDADGRIVQVDFLDGTNRLARLTTSPYLFDWTDAGIGSHFLSAVAVDNRGGSNLSAGVTVTIVPPAPPPSQIVSLIPTGSVWRYFDAGTNPGALWKDLGFNDTSWGQGPAELGYGDKTEGRPEATELQFGSDPRNKYITYYFRTAFLIDSSQQFTNLTVDLLRDDGAVVYLNGSEILRDNMPTNAITPATLAVAAVNKLEESTYFSYSVPARFLRPGANVVAVELHQASTNSTDISFDLGLTGIQIGPPILIQQPTNTQAIAGSIATFKVNAAGASPLQYQWYFNRITPIRNATNAILQLNPVSSTDEGSYSVIVSNSFASVRSEDATLQILTGTLAITKQPLDVAAEPGADVNFSVEAQGLGGSLQYQWFFNTNTVLAGQTRSILSVKAITAAQAGFYSVRVSNGGENLLSTAAELRLLVRPTLVGFEYTGTRATLTFNSISRLRYTAEYTDSLATPASIWNIIPGALQIKGTGSPISLSDPTPSPRRRFYRIRVE